MSFPHQTQRPTETFRRRRLSSRSHGQRLATAFILLLAGIASNLESSAQPSPPDPRVGDALKIAFLHQLQNYENADQNSKNQLAARLGIPVSDLKPLFAAVQEFATAERDLMLEAKGYRERQNALSKPLDSGTVRAFATRRYALARSAVVSLQTGLSAVSYAAIQRFLATEFPKSVVFWR